MANTRIITEYDQYLFGQGTHYDLYEKLGAHVDVQNGEEGIYFAVWAPNAKAVSLVGDFNDWDSKANPMERIEPMGIYQTFIPGMKPGTSIMVKSGIPKQSQQRTNRAAFSPESISRDPPSHIGFEATIPITSESNLAYPTTILFPKS